MMFCLSRRDKGSGRGWSLEVENFLEDLRGELLGKVDSEEFCFYKFILFSRNEYGSPGYLLSVL